MSAPSKGCDIPALPGKAEPSWNRCEGWFPEGWDKPMTCDIAARTRNSKLCMCCTKRKQRYSNLEKFRAKRREYYKENPQKFKNYAYDDYWKHREDRLMRSSIYYLKNAEKICAKKREKRTNEKRLDSKTDTERSLGSKPVSG